MKKHLLYVLGVVGALGATSLTSFTARAANTKSTSGYMVTTKQVKAGKVTLPKGTRVSVLYTKTNGKTKTARVANNELNYGLRKQANFKNFTVKVNGNFKKTTKPAFTYFGSYLIRKSHVQAAKLTANNYLEYFENGKLNQKPIVSVKLSKEVKSGDNLYLYSPKNMPKFPDKQIRKTGQFKYRLTIHKIGANTYKIGDLQFYSPVGND